MSAESERHAAAAAPRKGPKYGARWGWKAFERWADRAGIGEHPDDWEPWWECWKAAYSRAMATGGDES